MNSMKRIAFILLLVLIFPLCCLAESETLTIHFLDVGQGDAALIQCGGQTLMIDGGDGDHSQFVYSYLTELGLEYLDYVIATHPHDDHIQGLATALVVCDAGTVYSTVREDEAAGFQDLRVKLSERGKEIRIPHRGDTFMLGKATVKFLTEPQESWENMNDRSLMVKIKFGKTAFLFTGDAAGAAEEDALAGGLDLRADVLKVGHHGSSSSTSQAFLNAVRPTYAVISVGLMNKYGHPAPETMLKLQHMGAIVYRTDKQGTIICTSDGEKITFRMARKDRKW